MKIHKNSRRKSDLDFCDTKSTYRGIAILVVERWLYTQTHHNTQNTQVTQTFSGALHSINHTLNDNSYGKTPTGRRFYMWFSKELCLSPYEWFPNLSIGSILLRDTDLFVQMFSVPTSSPTVWSSRQTVTFWKRDLKN